MVVGCTVIILRLAIAKIRVLGEAQPPDLFTPQKVLFEMLFRVPMLYV
jgi:hypothetical protein